jgi:AraC-like DNA-binding protein
MNDDNPILNLKLTDEYIDKLKQVQIKHEPLWKIHDTAYFCRYCDAMAFTEEALADHKCTPERERIKELEQQVSELHAQIERMQAGK